MYIYIQKLPYSDCNDNWEDTLLHFHDTLCIMSILLL